MFCNQLPENKSPAPPRFAQATLQGLGGVAAFVIAGDWTPALAALLPLGAGLAPGRVAHGWLRGADNEPIDEVLLCRLPRIAEDAEGEANGEDTWLLTGHGGTACAQAARRALIAAGCVPADAPSSPSSPSVPAVPVPLAPPAPAFLSAPWAALAAACRSRAQALAVAAACAAGDLAALPRLRETLRPRRVCLAGAPNAGKSSLFNALLAAEHALVTAVPGTTRDSVARPAAFGPYAGELVDTAGFRHDGADALETAAQKRGAAALARADAVVWVVAADAPPPDAASPAARAVVAAERPVVVAYNKTDLLPDRAVPESLRTTARAALAAQAATSRPAPIVAEVAVAAIDGQGLDELRAAVAAALADVKSAP